MIENKIIRRVDDLGRIALPKEIRSQLRIKEFDPLEITSVGSTIILRKAVEAPHGENMIPEKKLH